MEDMVIDPDGLPSELSKKMAQLEKLSIAVEGAD